MNHSTHLPPLTLEHLFTPGKILFPTPRSPLNVFPNIPTTTSKSTYLKKKKKTPLACPPKHLCSSFYMPVIFYKK